MYDARAWSNMLFRRWMRTETSPFPQKWHPSTGSGGSGLTLPGRLLPDPEPPPPIGTDIADKLAGGGVVATKKHL